MSQNNKVFKTNGFYNNESLKKKLEHRIFLFVELAPLIAGYNSDFPLLAYRTTLSNWEWNFPVCVTEK